MASTSSLTRAAAVARQFQDGIFRHASSSRGGVDAVAFDKQRNNLRALWNAQRSYRAIYESGLAYVDRNALQARGMTLNSVVNALNDNNIIQDQRRSNLRIALQRNDVAARHTKPARISTEGE
ncbi:MAG: hypothetical protein ACYDC3_09915 [Candidatus Binataceae bacterium]